MFIDEFSSFFLLKMHRNVKMLHVFGAPDKTTQPFLMILCARKTRDHACSREKEIIQIVRLRTKIRCLRGKLTERGVIPTLSCPCREPQSRVSHVPYPSTVLQAERVKVKPRGNGLDYLSWERLIAVWNIIVCFVHILYKKNNICRMLSMIPEQFSALATI